MTGPVPVYVIHSERDASPAKYIVHSLQHHNWHCWSRATAPRREIVDAEDILAAAQAVILIGTRAATVSRIAELDLRRAIDGKKLILLLLFEADGARLSNRNNIDPQRLDVRIVGLENMPLRIIDILSPLITRTGVSVPGKEASNLQKWWRLFWYRAPKP